MTIKSTGFTDRHVGKRLKLRRVMLGLSQTDVANAIGVSFQQLQKNEAGTNRIAASRVVLLSEALQFKPEFFFEMADGQPIQSSSSPDYITDFLAMPEGIALVKAFRRLPAGKLRRRLIALIEELADLDRSV